MRFPTKLNKLAAAVALVTGGAILAAGGLPPALAIEGTPPVQVEMTVPDFSALVQQNAAAVVNVTVAGKKSPATVMRGIPEQDDEDNPFAFLLDPTHGYPVEPFRPYYEFKLSRLKLFLMRLIGEDDRAHIVG